MQCRVVAISKRPPHVTHHGHAVRRHHEALFGTRVLVGTSGDNPLEYWVKPLPSPNPHKTLPIIH
jgi:hypothetical protein